MAEIQKELLKVAKAHNDTLWNTCTEIWRFILLQEQDVQGNYFSTFLSQIYQEDIGITDYQQFSSEEVLSRISDDIDQLGNRIVENLVQQKMTEEAFYENLWGKICDSALLSDQTAQIAFLARLWLDPRIPYYQVEEGCTMENDEFIRIRQKIWPTLKKAYFILSIPIPQKTQRASLLMKLSNEIGDEREQAVFWASVIARLRRGSRQTKASGSVDKSS